MQWVYDLRASAMRLLRVLLVVGAAPVLGTVRDAAADAVEGWSGSAGSEAPLALDQITSRGAVR